MTGSQWRVEPQNLRPEPNPQLLDFSEAVLVPTPQGVFSMQAWAFADRSEHISVQAMTAEGQPVPHELAGIPAVRVHSECATGDIFGSFRCDCGPQLKQGLEITQRIGGYMIYTKNHEGRGIGLVNKLRAYALQDQGLDTLEANLRLGLGADERDYRQTAVILHRLGLTKIRLITNNPAKEMSLGELGIEIAGLVPDRIEPRAENMRYLETKRDRMNHLLPFSEAE